MVHWRKGALALCLLALMSCGSLETKAEFPEDDVYGRPLRPGQQQEEGLLSNFSFGTSRDSDAAATNLPVNRYLWRASLDTLAFLPLSSTDPYGGVIVTEWGSTDAQPDDRYKVSAYITSAVLKPQSLRVVVNRQSQNGSGQWVEASVNPETARRLENAILTRARQIRSEEPEN